MSVVYRPDQCGGKTGHGMKHEQILELPGAIVTDDRLRFLANMPGQYYLEKWRSNRDGQVGSFSCRIQRISPTRLTLAAPVSGERGDKVVCHFDEFGVLTGDIARPLGFGFVLSLALCEDGRRKLSSKIAWFERRKNYQVHDNRGFRRMVPRNPQSSIILSDGTRMGCFVIDMSATGAAISADIVLERGTPLALGTVVGRVVRTIETGFAMRFTETLDPAELEARLIRPMDMNCVEFD